MKLSELKSKCELRRDHGHWPADTNTGWQALHEGVAHCAPAGGA